MKILIVEDEEKLRNSLAEGLRLKGKACKMGCVPVKNANSLECIRCGKCKNICPTHAIEYCTVSKSMKKKDNSRVSQE